LALQRFIKRNVEKQIFVPIITQAGLDPVKADCRLNWGMPEKPDVEALLPMLVNISRDRPDIVSAKEFRKILVDMGLALEKAESSDAHATKVELKMK